MQLSSWEQLTSAQIGTVLAMPAETVRTRLRRARARLRTDLALADPEDEHEPSTVRRLARLAPVPEPR